MEKNDIGVSIPVIEHTQAISDEREVAAGVVEQKVLTLGVADGESRKLTNEFVILSKVDSKITALREAIDPLVISQEFDVIGRVELSIKIASDLSKKEKLAKEIETQKVRQEELQDLIESGWRSGNEQHKKVMGRRKSMWGKFLKVLHLPDRKLQQLNAEIEEKQTAQITRAAEYDELCRQREEAEAQLEQIPDSDDLLHSYYEKVADTPLSDTEKRELLKPEALAQLSTAEYLKLWRRLNPHYLSHVTRQGFKEEGFQEWQDGFFSGFEEITKDGKMLRSLLHGVRHLRTKSEKSIREFLETSGVLKCQNVDEAERSLEKMVNEEKFSMPWYPDQSSIHMANNSVLDEYYGAEFANQIFIVYPADVLISQNPFQVFGENRTLKRSSTADLSSDCLVYPQDNENPGISIDAGIVFLPDSIKVDPLSGSKYQSVVGPEGKRSRVEDAALIDKYTNLMANENSLIRKAMIDYKKWSYSLRELNRVECLKNIETELSNMGFPTDVVKKLAYQTFVDLNLHESFTPEQSMAILRRTNSQWKRPENGISAREYWNMYFRENPDKSPKHVVFYDGAPTTAVANLLTSNGIKNDSSTDDLLGFEDNHVADMRNDPRANNGREEFIQIAKRLIKQKYI